MITRDQAYSAEEFHVAHAGLPCTVWQRAGDPVYDLPDGGFLVFIRRYDETTDEKYLWHHVTGVNAADFHAPGDCPRRQGDDKPPVSDRSEGQLVLGTPGSGDDGYDEYGYDEAGYDRDGYDANGYDEDGYDANGYDEDGKRNGPDASDLDLADLWGAFPRTGRWNSARTDQDSFRQHLRGMVSDPDDIDNLEFCQDCDVPAWDDDLSTGGNGMRICSSCWDDWSYCGYCDEKYPGDDLYEVLGGTDVCENCRGNHYSYCDYCDGYYHDDDSYDHDHGGGCCESPQLAFRVRNDGCAPLANDQRITVTLPAGHISAEGLKAISQYLRGMGHYDVSYDLHELGDQWQTRQGNFSKRLSRLAYQRHQAKITPDVLSQVGCIARDHSNAVDVRIEVSRELNQDAGYWYHEDSCWWGSYSDSRCALKTNGGLGLRSFDQYGDVSGRAWVMPLRKDDTGRLVPTFETLTPDAFVVFNGYGDLANYAAPRVIAHMAGWTYRKIDFYASPMYVNSGGYLIAPEDIAEQYTDGELTLDTRQHSRLFETEKERNLVHA